MYCPQCGKDIGEQQEGYCPNCGKKVNSMPSVQKTESSETDTHAQRKKKDNEQILSVLSLIFGILSIICGLGGYIFIFGGPTIGLILGIVGLVFSKKRTEYTSYAKIGKVCSIIGIIVSILVLVTTAVFVGIGVYWDTAQGTQPY